MGVDTVRHRAAQCGMSEKLPRVSVSLTDSENRKVKRLAKEWRMSVSATVARIVREWGKK